MMVFRSVKALRTIRWSLLNPHSVTTNPTNSSFDTTYPGRHESSHNTQPFWYLRCTFSLLDGASSDANGGGDTQIGRVVVHVLKKPSQTAESILSSGVGIGHGANKPRGKRKSTLQNVTQCLKPGRILWSRSGLLRRLCGVGKFSKIWSTREQN